MAQPNFVVIMTDQQRADHLGCYGNPLLRTPHIDRLAAAGCRFDNCFVATPVCMPNRASFMTGRMPSLHGVRCNGIPLSRRMPTFVDILRAGGYATALIGKSHLQNMEDHGPVLARPPDGGRRTVAGFEEARPDRLDGPDYRQESPRAWSEPAHRIATPYYGFEHVELADDHGDLVFGDYARWLAERDPAAAASRGRDGALPAPDRVAPQAWRTTVPEDLYPSAFVGERSAEWLKARAAAADRKPFFLMCSFPDPHHPFTPPGRYFDMYDPADIALPPNFARPLAEMPPPLAWLHAEHAAGKAPKGAHRVFAVDEREAREATALTYGMISLIDDQVGRIVAALEAAGLAEDTVVVFMSDHGDFMGDQGLLLKGPLHYRSLIRVPLIWAEPDAPGPHRAAGLAATIDLAETILARAGLAAPNGTQGRSLLDLIAGRAEAVRDALIVEDETQRAFLGFEEPVRMRTLVTPSMRLSLYAEGGVGELYDLDADPFEMRNLYDDPAAAGIRAELMERMVRAMMDLADRSPFPTGRA